jgi:hypothetical protein
MTYMQLLLERLQNPMFSASYYFLGLAVFLIAAMACLTRGKQINRHIELDLEDLRAASIGMVMAGSKPSWNEIRSLWMNWYASCQEKAIVKQRAVYSWARTLALCAVLCLIGVLLEAEFDKQITVQTIWHNFFPG